VSGSSLKWEDELTKALASIRAKSKGLSQDAAVGAELILTEARDRAPKESGDLAASGRVRKNRGGVNTAAVTFSGPYARWIHEHLWFKHPRGGEAKFLETALLWKGEEAVNEAGKHFWRRIT
jgi:hypothetical protein